MRTPTVRKGQPSVALDRAAFRDRFEARFRDPAYDSLRPEIARLEQVAWEAYHEGRKAPVTRPAGPGYADPDYALSVDWIAAKEAIEAAKARRAREERPSRVLLISGGDRHEQTCPGEVSKTFRLAAVAAEALQAASTEVDLLDLAEITAEYGKTIHPCKACVSTAMPLCHWPCSCYPNHSLGQVHDWMNELYPRWVEADGVIVITPVYWYQAPSALKLMIDRLVCADGGNPDPTSTGGKDAARAKRLELKGWPFPRHLAGRLFGVVVHGDYAGAETLRHALSDWLTDLGLIDAGARSTLDRYIGYQEPYATSHDALDADEAVQEEVRNVARAVAAAVSAARAGANLDPGAALEEPRPK